MTVLRPITHPNPDVSVVVPTIPRNEYDVPENLRNQNVEEYEVIVVSDASINRCEARNKGMEVANAEIVAQTDDDCKPPITWIEQIRTNFELYSDLVLLEGFLDKLDREARGYIGANLAYKREKAVEIGGFDPELSGWRADTDFGWRMEDEYGIERCKADTENVIEHIGPLRTSVDRNLERKFRMRHPKKYFEILFYPDIEYGQKIGSLFARLYSVNPFLGERLITSFRHIRNNYKRQTET